jgi:ribosomal protein L11 methyltransferase
LLLVDALRRLGARAVEPAGHRVAALFPPPSSVDALLWEVERAVRASTTLADPDLAWRWQSLEERAHRWALEVETRRVTPRLVVTHAEGEVEAGDQDMVIRLHAATAFGTAEHPTTRACLRYLDGLVRPGVHVLDIGTGSGILAIAAALLGARRVVAVEADPMACDAAAINVALNGLSDRVEVRLLDVTARSLARLTQQSAPARYGGVVANLEAGWVTPLLPALPGALSSAGWLVVSGILEPERDGIVAAGARAGLELRDEALEGAWWTGCFGPPSS